MTQIPMSPTPERRVRPAVVTASSGLLVFVVVLMLINVVLGVAANNSEVQAAAKDLANSQNGGVSPDVQRWISYAATALFGAIFIVLAALNLRGNQVSRIVTWVLGGLGALCCSCSVIFQGAAGALLDAAGDQAREAKEAYNRLMDAYPSWYIPAMITISVLAAVALVVALILLALPAANDYFRKVEPEWNPPTQL